MLLCLSEQLEKTCELVTYSTSSSVTLLEFFSHRSLIGYLITDIWLKGIYHGSKSWEPHLQASSSPCPCPEGKFLTHWQFKKEVNLEKLTWRMNKIQHKNDRLHVHLSALSIRTDLYLEFYLGFRVKFHSFSLLYSFTVYTKHVNFPERQEGI